MNDGRHAHSRFGIAKVGAIYRSIRKMRRPTTTNSTAIANETTVSKSQGRNSISWLLEQTLCQELISIVLENTQCCSMHGSADRGHSIPHTGN
jgi:hypothetical protein